MTEQTQPDAEGVVDLEPTATSEPTPTGAVDATADQGAADAPDTAETTEAAEASDAPTETSESQIGRAHV